MDKLYFEMSKLEYGEINIEEVISFISKVKELNVEDYKPYEKDWIGLHMEEDIPTDKEIDCAFFNRKVAGFFIKEEVK